MKNCLVIFNPTAGPRRLRRLRDVLGLLRARGVEVTVCETFAPRDGERIAREARGYHVIVAAGGDGTINEVVNGIHARDDGCNLGVVPLGTANVLARELGIDSRSPEAIVNAIMAQTPANGLTGSGERARVFHDGRGRFRCSCGGQCEHKGQTRDRQVCLCCCFIDRARAVSRANISG